MSVIKIFVVTCILSIICLSHSSIIAHENIDITSTLINSAEQKSPEDVFSFFHFLFKKNYLIDSPEGYKRFHIFKSNYEFIKEFNSKNTYKLGINEFSDLTDEEFKSKFITNTIPFLEETSDQLLFLGEKVDDREGDSNEQIYLNDTTEIDWTPYFNPTKDQGDCGSCWALTTIQAIEGNYYLKYGKSPEFSPQQLVDCDVAYNNGCRGGSPILALDYIIKKGISYENAYPYVSGDFNQHTLCRQSENVMNKVVSGYDECQGRSCTYAQWLNLLKQGPIIVYMDGDGNNQGSVIFHRYKEGIIDNMTCIEKNHSVLVIGVGIDALGKYYIGKNSWGTSWGENGNFRFRVRAQDKSCFMEESAILVKVSETKNPVPPPPEKGCLKAYSQCAYNGSYNELCENAPKLSIQKVLGINIGKFSNVKVFTNENCVGGYYTLSKNYGCLTNPGQIPELAGQAKSFLIKEEFPDAGCIYFYSNSCLSGVKTVVCDNVAKFQNKIMSFSSNKSDFKIFTKPGCNGSYVEFESEQVYDFNTSAPSLVNNAGSILLNDISPPFGCIWLYSDYCLSGDKLEICKDVADLSIYNFLKKTSSMKIGSGIKGLIIYEKANFMGSYATIPNDSYYGFIGQWMDKWMSSLKIQK